MKAQDWQGARSMSLEELKYQEAMRRQHNETYVLAESEQSLIPDLEIPQHRQA
jgi:hypothetical protein